MAAGDHELDPLLAERRGSGGERVEVLARGVRGDRQDVGAPAPGGHRFRREARVDAAVDHLGLDVQQFLELVPGERRDGDDRAGAAGDQRQQPALPGRVEAAVPAGVPQRRRVVEDHDGVARGHRGEVRRAQQDVGAGALDRQHELLPGVAGAMRQRGWRRERPVGEPRAQLARPALHPTQLRPHRRAPVDHGSHRASVSVVLALIDIEHDEAPRPPSPPGRVRPPIRHGSARPAARRAGQPARAHARGPARVPRTRPGEPAAAPAVDVPARAGRPVRRALRPFAPRGLPVRGRDPHRDGRDHRRVHDLPDRPRRLPIRLPRLLRAREVLRARG